MFHNTVCQCFNWIEKKWSRPAAAGQRPTTHLLHPQALKKKKRKEEFSHIWIKQKALWHTHGWMSGRFKWWYWKNWGACPCLLPTHLTGREPPHLLMSWHLTLIKQISHHATFPATRTMRCSSRVLAANLAANANQFLHTRSETVIQNDRPPKSVRQTFWLLDV